MWRVIGFFLLIFGLMRLLRFVPVIGGVFQGLWGFWITSIVVSLVGTWLVNRAVARRRLRSERRALEFVDSARNQGKLGTLLLSAGDARGAIEPLQRAAREEPELPEWHYQLGRALLDLGRAREALEPLERVAAIDEEYGYGEVQLRLAEAHMRLREPASSLEALERFDRNHGPSPESAYRRGVAQRALGDSAAARASFAEVGVLGERAAQFQRGRNRGWIWRARIARLV